jgi:hypothetical protein
VLTGGNVGSVQTVGTLPAGAVDVDAPVELLETAVVGADEDADDGCGGVEAVVTAGLDVGAGSPPSSLPEHEHDSASTTTLAPHNLPSRPVEMIGAL